MVVVAIDAHLAVFAVVGGWAGHKVALSAEDLPLAIDPFVLGVVVVRVVPGWDGFVEVYNFEVFWFLFS